MIAVIKYNKLDLLFKSCFIITFFNLKIYAVIYPFFSRRNVRDEDV